MRTKFLLLTAILLLASCSSVSTQLSELEALQNQTVNVGLGKEAISFGGSEFYSTSFYNKLIKQSKGNIHPNLNHNINFLNIKIKSSLSVEWGSVLKGTAEFFIPILGAIPEKNEGFFYIDYAIQDIFSNVIYKNSLSGKVDSESRGWYIIRENVEETKAKMLDFILNESAILIINDIIANSKIINEANINVVESQRILKGVQIDLNNNNYTLAISKLQAVPIEKLKYKKLDDLYSKLGDNSLEKKDYSHALKKYRLIRNQDISEKKIIALCVKKGDAYLETNEYNKAIEEYKKIDDKLLSKDKTDNAYDQLGDKLWAKRKYDDAIKQYKKISDTTKSIKKIDEISIKLGDRFYSKMQYSNAIKRYEYISNEEQRKQKIQNSVIGRCKYYYKNKRYEKALTDLKKIESDLPSLVFFTLNNNIAVSLAKKNNLTKAIERFSISLNRSNIEDDLAFVALYNKAVAQYKKGDRKEAKKSLLRLKKLYSNRDISSMKLEYIYIK